LCEGIAHIFMKKLSILMKEYLRWGLTFAAWGSYVLLLYIRPYRQ